jgi:hypothetical protein
MLPVTLWPLKGVHRRTAEEQIALSCRILGNEHEGDVYRRASATLGDRVDVITPLDLTRNPLLQTTDRINRAHVSRPPFVYDLDPRLAALLGDASASTTVDRYATAGGRPMPTTAAQASHETQRYRIGVGYGGCAIGWSPRSALIYLEPIASCDLRLVYASDDPTEPTVIEWRTDGDDRRQGAAGGGGLRPDRHRRAILSGHGRRHRPHPGDPRQDLRGWRLLLAHRRATVSPAGHRGQHSAAMAQQCPCRGLACGAYAVVGVGLGNGP